MAEESLDSKEGNLEMAVEADEVMGDTGGGEEGVERRGGGVGTFYLCMSIAVEQQRRDDSQHANQRMQNWS